VGVILGNEISSMKYFFITALIVLASAAPTAIPYVLHEKRQSDDLKWAPSNIKVDSRTVFPLSIGLTQRNLDKGHDYLMAVSDPTSPNYGKHWTPMEVGLLGL
jgi:tripeptidyl-peptidase-1